jgi:hypothetical protein
VDITDLFTPKELAENRIAFLERILAYYQDIGDIRERAKIVGHKIHGTGGNLGLEKFIRDGINLQIMVEKDSEENVIVDALNSLKGAVMEELESLRGSLSDAPPSTQ